MKTCLICGATAQDNCATCPKCGEASWRSTNVSLSAEGIALQEQTRIAIEADNGGVPPTGAASTPDPELTQTAKQQGKRR